MAVVPVFRPLLKHGRPSSAQGSPILGVHCRELKIIPSGEGVAAVVLLSLELGMQAVPFVRLF